MKKSDPLRKKSHHLRKVVMGRDRKLKGKEGRTPSRGGDVIMPGETSESLQVRV